MDKKLLLTLIAYTGLLLIGYLLFRIFAPFLTSLAWALILGTVTRPIYRRVQAGLKGRESLAAALMTVLAVVAVVIPVLLAVYLVLQEATASYHYLSEFNRPGRDIVSELGQKPVINQIVSRIQPYLSDLNIDELRAHAVELAKKAGAHAAALAAYWAKHLLEIIAHLVFMLFFLFFIYRDGQRMVSALWRLIRVDSATRELVSATTRKALAAFVFGVLLTALAQALVAWIGYMVAGLPSPFFFAALTALSGFIPGVGTMLVWVPCVIYLALAGKMGAAIGLTVWNLLMIVVVVDHLVRPAVMGRLIDLPLVLILIGGLGGIMALGMLGMVVGPLILSLIYALLKAELDQTRAEEDEQILAD